MSGVPSAAGKDLEQLAGVRLDQDGTAELLHRQTECTFVFSAPSGWASGVTMSFLYEDGAYWLTAVADRRHAKAVRNDPRVTLVITNAGTGLPGRRMLAIRGVATVHDDEATKRWFLPRFTTRIAEAPEEFARLLDSPGRVVIQVRPVSTPVSHDSRKLPGDGRGGPRPAGWEDSNPSSTPLDVPQPGTT